MEEEAGMAVLVVTELTNFFRKVTIKLVPVRSLREGLLVDVLLL